MDSQNADGGTDAGLDSRRDALRKFGVGVAVAWAVPVVVSSPAFAIGSDAPYPPGSCAACGQGNLVLNDQFNTLLPSPPAPFGSPANWARSGNGFVRTYAGSPAFTPVSGADQSNFLRLDTGSSFTQDVSIPGGCSELPFLFSAHAVARRGTLTGTVSFFRNSLANPVGTSQTISLTSAVFSSAFTSIATSPGVLLPAVNLADTIIARITFSFTSAVGDFGGVDAVTLSVGC